MTISTKSERELPEGTISTKLKFVKSDKTGAYVGFISQNPKTGRICGVRQDSEFPKKICIVDKKLAPEILINVLYDVTLIPMKEKDGYIAISAIPVQFKATIETNYIRKVVYQVLVKFGNKVVIFDPKDGKQESRRYLSKCREILEKRVDIKDITQVVDDFMEQATKLLRRYEADGFYYKAV